MDIAIIGAGPIGCYTGYLLAKAGYKIKIFENHSQIGMPIQCTGILTSDFDELNLPMDSFLVNTINQIKVNSPNNSVTIKQKDYIICRYKFDNFFANLARQAGASIFLNHAFTRKDGQKIIIYDSVNKTELKIQPGIIIAADGPLSATAKAFGLYHPQRENYYGIQAIVDGQFDTSTIETYFGNKVCPGLFAWVTPESATSARVGLAAKNDSKKYFDQFIAKNNFKIKQMQAGTIPVYHPQQKLYQDNCYLVGDASGYVKATTLGGLVPALQQAQILADSIINHNDYSQQLIKLRRKLWLHLQVQKIFNRFNDQDWDKLISYINQTKVKAIFEKYTRDNPIPLVTRALLKEPRLISFVKHLF